MFKNFNHLLIYFLPLVLICFMLSSCKKEENEEVIIKRPESLTFGNPVGVDITYFNKSFSRGDNPEIDVDMDGINDLSIVYKEEGPASWSKYLVVYIECLHNNVEIFGLTSIDSHYVEKTTFIQFLTNHFERTFSTIYYCDKRPNSVFYQTVGTTFKVIPADSNDLLPITGQFMSNNHQLFNGNPWSFPIHNRTFLYMDGDTAVYEQTIYNSECRNFPTTGVHYIGFKINHLGSLRLGWIKFNSGVMNVIAVAIQK